MSVGKRAPGAMLADIWREKWKDERPSRCSEPQDWSA
jgi:hypothetical protein